MATQVANINKQQVTCVTSSACSLVSSCFVMFVWWLIRQVCSCCTLWLFCFCFDIPSFLAKWKRKKKLFCNIWTFFSNFLCFHSQNANVHINRWVEKTMRLQLHVFMQWRNGWDSAVDVWVFAEHCSQVKAVSLSKFIYFLAGRLVLGTL